MCLQTNHNKRYTAFQRDPANGRVRWLPFPWAAVVAARGDLSDRRPVRRVWQEAHTIAVCDWATRKSVWRRFPPPATAACEPGACRKNWYVARTAPPPWVRAAFSLGFTPTSTRPESVKSCADEEVECLLLRGTAAGEGTGPAHRIVAGRGNRESGGGHEKPICPDHRL